MKKRMKNRTYKSMRLIGIALFLVTIMGLSLMPQEVHAGKGWGEFDIRTESGEGATVEKAKEMYEGYGYTNTHIYKNMDLIYDKAEEYGINPAYVVSVMTKESRWGLDYKAQQYYNFGGIKQFRDKTDIPNGRDQSFESAEDGILGVIKLLRKYAYKGITVSTNPDGSPLTKVKDVGQTYCPSSDGCDEAKYITDVGATMENLGQSQDGKLLKKGEIDEKTEKEDEVKDAEGNTVDIDDLYMEKNLAEDRGVGINSGNTPLGADLSNWAFTISKDVSKKLLYVGWFLSAVLILYMSVATMTYVMVTQGKSDGSLFNKMTKIDGVGNEALKKLVVRWIGVIILVMLFSTGLYGYIIIIIFEFLEKLLSLIM